MCLFPLSGLAYRQYENKICLFIENMRKGWYVGDRVALTDDFNIATYSGLLNSRITFFKNIHVSFSSDSKPLSL